MQPSVSAVSCDVSSVMLQDTEVRQWAVVGECSFCHHRRLWGYDRQMGDEYWSLVIFGAVGEHCEHSAPPSFVACCVWCVVCLAGSCWSAADATHHTPHTVHAKTISDKTELNDYSTKNRGDRSFLAVGQIVIYRCHYSYSKEGIKDNRKLGKTRYKGISGLLRYWF